MIKKYAESGELNKAIETGETNDPVLATILVGMYAQGNGEYNIKKSLKKSYKWLKLACDLKDVEAIRGMLSIFVTKSGADVRKVNNLEFDKDYMLQLCSYLAENDTDDKYKKMYCNVLGLYYAERPKSDFELSKQYFQKADNQQMVGFIDEINENYNNYLDENTSENIVLLLDSLFMFVGLDKQQGWFVFNVIKDNEHVSSFDSCFMSIFGVDILQTLLNEEPEECKKWFDRFNTEFALRHLYNIGTYHDFSSFISTYSKTMDDTVAFKNSYCAALSSTKADTDAMKKAFILLGFDIFKGRFYFESTW